MLLGDSTWCLALSGCHDSHASAVLASLVNLQHQELLLQACSFWHHLCVYNIKSCYYKLQDFHVQQVWKVQLQLFGKFAVLQDHVHLGLCVHNSLCLHCNLI